MLGSSLIANPIRRAQGVRRVHIEQMMRDIEFGRNERERVMPVWCEAYEYAMPDRAIMARRRGTVRMPDYVGYHTSVPIRALRRGVSFVVSTMMPPETQWVQLTAGSAFDPREHDRLNRIFEADTDRMFDWIHASNHAAAVHESGFDLFMGMGPMQVLAGDAHNPLVFNAVPLTQVVTVRGPHGDHWRIYYENHLPVELVKERYPTAQIPPQWRNKKPTDEVDVVEATIYQPRTGDWVSIVLAPEHKLPITEPEVRSTSGWIIPEWQRVTGESYPWGPLREALADMRELNHSVREWKRALELRGAPPLWADPIAMQANPFTLSLEPRAINYMPDRAMGALELGSDPSAGERSVDDLVESVRRSLLDIDVLPPVADGRQMTRAEVLIREQETIRDAGADFGRLQKSWLFATAREVSAIMREAGAFSPVQLDNREVKVGYRGPLQQAQEATEAETILDYAERGRAAFGDESFMLTTKGPEGLVEVGEKLGVPHRLLRDDDERALAMQQRAALAAAEVAGSA